ncbi:sensor histidine kinase [Marinobacterium arenosum]|uniref:sensor histidine kinase n=1 Tax=Marinobacterium arenosum TaxID=2862496 RepID=UPI001C9628CB|nr:ATP-binding protein [Marinobacterium arenosum]MBY4675447.1 hypothetical protein [Marinobacterium arenosum]
MSTAPSHVAEGTAKRPLARALAWWLAGFIGLLVLSLLLLAGWHLGEFVSHQRQQALDHRLADVQQSLKVMLDDRLSVLRDYARLGWLQQQVSATQSTASSSSLSELNLLGVPAQLMLLDRQGSIVHSSQPLPQFSYQDQPWVTPLIEGRLSSYIGINEQFDETYWRLAVPVEQRGRVIGTLVAELPGKTLLQSLQTRQSLGDMRLTLLFGGRELGAVGEPLAASRVLVVEGPAEGVQLQFALVPAPSVLQHWVTHWPLAGGSLLISLMIGGLAYRSANRRLVQPLRSLQSGNLVKGHPNTDALQPQTGLQELDQLVDRMTLLSQQAGEQALDLRQCLQTQQQQKQQLQFSEEKQRQAERLASVGTLVTGVAHEISNPLGFIKSNLATLQGYNRQLVALAETCRLHRDDPGLAQLVKEQVQQLERDKDLEFVLADIEPLLSESLQGTKRIEQVLRGLNNVTRIDLSSRRLVDVNELLEGAVSLAQSELQGKGHLRTELRPVVRVSANSGQLNQVFGHLLQNAVQALETGGEILVASCQQGAEVVVTIRDNGRGMDEETQARLFTPFFSTRDGQAGLGLSVSRSIIEEHGGRIELTSQPGSGTTIRILLPAMMLEKN